MRPEDAQASRNRGVRILETEVFNGPSVHAPMPAIRLALQRSTIRRTRFFRLFHLHQHISQQLARGRERAGRHRRFLRRILAVCCGAHLLYSTIEALFGEVQPRITFQMLNRDLFGPVRLVLRDETLLNRRQRVT